MFTLIDILENKIVKVREFSSRRQKKVARGMLNRRAEITITQGV